MGRSAEGGEMKRDAKTRIIAKLKSARRLCQDALEIERANFATSGLSDWTARAADACKFAQDCAEIESEGN